MSESASTGAPGAGPTVDSLWRSNDPRDKGRVVKVVGVWGENVGYRNVHTDRLAYSHPRTFKIRFSELNIAVQPASSPAVPPETPSGSTEGRAELLAVMKEIMAVLMKEAPGTALNNHQYDALGIRAWAAISKAEAASLPPVWKCGARASTDPPQDCEWPTCGCDPYADKVVSALQESGALQTAPMFVQPPETPSGSTEGRVVIGSEWCPKDKSDQRIVKVIGLWRGKVAYRNVVTKRLGYSYFAQFTSKFSPASLPPEAPAGPETTKK